MKQTEKCGNGAESCEVGEWHSYDHSPHILRHDLTDDILYQIGRCRAIAVVDPKAPFTVRDFFRKDFRRFEKFPFCPQCGRKNDWDAIKAEVIGGMKLRAESVKQ
jgi:hypothetical protein